jgi:hypothetical protein
MALKSNAKRKSARGKKDRPEFWITDWVVDQASTPRRVSISVFVVQESDDGTSRSTAQRFLLRCERPVELINELKEMLDDSAAIQRIEEHAATDSFTFNVRPALASVRNDTGDNDLPSSHFDLGAYGLLGN